jgi:hypothetical protein
MECVPLALVASDAPAVAWSATFRALDLTFSFVGCLPSLPHPAHELDDRLLLEQARLLGRAFLPLTVLGFFAVDLAFEVIDERSLFRIARASCALELLPCLYDLPPPSEQAPFRDYIAALATLGVRLAARQHGQKEER